MQRDIADCKLDEEKRFLDLPELCSYSVWNKDWISSR